MLYLIGLGLNKDSISKKGLDVVKKCEKIYLENYTVEFPYDVKELEKTLGKKPEPVDRNFVEGFKFLEDVKKSDVALLIYGSPLAATTHISIIQEARKKKIPTEVIQGTSIFDAIGETGLQIYKFGKTASMPSFSADSYTGIIKDNLKIKAHSLVLVDIGLGFQEALKKLDVDCNKNGVKLDKVIICERLGSKDAHTYYDSINRLRYLKVKAPFCIIIPTEFHFIEKEFLEKI